MKTKLIIVFGGVYSSLGKGIIASSIGAILSNLGFKISMQKMDPYLNINSGRLSPYQHGEVFVTYDGLESDLDLGNYERFISQKLNKYAGITSGNIYWQVINDEKNDKYNGNTIQIVPTITDAIKEKINKHIAKNNPDFLIIEVGGTIGDIESLPFIEAINQFKMEYGIENCLPILVAPLIKLSNGEYKTKPIQHAWRELNSLGINPKMLIIRSQKKINNENYKKISINCHLPINKIFNTVDCQSIYYVPQHLYNQNITNEIFESLNIKFDKRNDHFNYWTNCLKKIETCKKILTIAIVGKYVELHDAYASLIESLKFASWKNNCQLKIVWIKANDVLKKQCSKIFEKIKGIIVPGGFGVNGTEGKIKAINYARINKIPFLGIGLGMELALIEFARNILKIPNANSTEFDKNCFPIFCLNETQQMILGEKECLIKNNTLSNKIYSTKKIAERFRYKYIFNQKNKNIFEKNGVIFGITLMDKNESIVNMELPQKIHPFFWCSQYHPEYNCSFFNPDDCFFAFIKASLNNSKF